MSTTAAIIASTTAVNAILLSRSGSNIAIENVHCRIILDELAVEIGIDRS